MIMKKDPNILIEITRNSLKNYEEIYNIIFE